jgi:hypothetical protein
MYRTRARLPFFIAAIALSTANAVPQQRPREKTAAVSPRNVKVLLQGLQDSVGQVATLVAQIFRITDKSSSSCESAVNALPVSE